MQKLDPRLTTWHITFGTYGTRLHGDYRATVDKKHNEFGTPFLGRDAVRKSGEENRMRFPSVIFTAEQRLFLQNAAIPICERGQWQLRTCAAGEDHFHILLDIDPKIHGERVRRLLKRWLTQELNQRWPLGGPKKARTKRFTTKAI